MDEDEECLPETSSLYKYLQNLGFSDVQVIQNEEGSLINKIKTSMSKLQLPVKVIDKNVIDQIEVITSTKLLFEEDFAILKILLSNFKVLNNEVPKIQYKDRSMCIVIVLGLCLYLMIGYFALVIISPFYAYKCTNYFGRKNQNENVSDENQIKNLVKVLRHNSATLNKCVDFINRKKNKFLLLHANRTEVSFEENVEVDFYFYARFRNEFLSIIIKMINILCFSTQELIKKVPLIDYADIPEYYLCSHCEMNFTCEDPSKLYLLYMLIQSEFLRRIILTLIPANHALPKGNFKFEKLLKNFIAKLKKLHQTLQKNFHFAFYEGFQAEFKLSKIEESPANDYAGKFISSIHDTAEALSNLLLKFRLLEESLKSEEFPKNIEATLVKLQTAFKDCQRNIENGFILLKKANAITKSVNEDVAEKEETVVNDYEKSKEKFLLENSAESEDITKEGVNLFEEEIATSEDNINKIKVGDTNLANEIEDDVFEVYINKENQGADFTMDNCDLDEVLKDNLKKEFSQSVMKELKGRLVEQAENWKKREMNVLRKKGLIDSNSIELPTNQPVEGEIETEPKPENAETYDEDDYFEKQTRLDPRAKRSFSEDVLKQGEQKLTQEFLGNLCKDFLKDLSETRKLILTLPTAEEEFHLCVSDEESLDDKNAE